MQGLSPKLRVAFKWIDRLSDVSSKLDALIAKASTSRERAPLYVAKSVITTGKLRIIRAASGDDSHSGRLLSLQSKAKGGPNCGTGAGGFKQGNDCASGKGGGKGSGGGSGSSPGTQATARRKRERKIDPGRPKFFEKSDVRWEYGEPNREQVKKLREQFGANYKKRLLAVSGIPDGSQVDLSYNGDYVNVKARNSQLGTYQNRYVYFGLNGRKPRVYNAYFEVNSSKQSKGVGAEIFFAQVEASARAKFDSISVTAARSAGMNGYYTWARFGYDAPISELSSELRNSVRQKFPDAERVSDLMKSKQGRDWWKQNGSTWKGKFDLSKNSEGRKRLRNYMAAKRRAYRSSLAASSSSQTTSSTKQG